MKSFEFRLERVLRWRAAQLTSEEAKLRRLIEEHARIAEKVHQLRAEKFKTEGGAASLASLHGNDLATLQGYRFHVANEEKRLREALNRKEQELAVQQRSYREAKQRLRLLEELRNRRLSTWRHEWGKEIEEVAAESFMARRARDRASS
jgi:flagellar export protein FliJ